MRNAARGGVLRKLATTVSLFALLLDGVDGWWARRHGLSSAFGARFDMETDALLILVLALLAWHLGKAGAWVILSGALRYLFVAAGWLLPFLDRPLPPSDRRRVICVIQIAVLVACFAPILAPVLTTPLAAVVAEAMDPFLRTAYGNPSSLHWAGVPAHDAVEEARSHVAALLCCDATEVVFTSGGTEANNLALRSLFTLPTAGSGRPSLIVSRIEHPSVLRTAEALEREHVHVSWLDPGEDGRVDPAAVERALTSGSAGARLVSLQAVNHETGVLQPLAEVKEICGRFGAFLHTDAVQAIGRLSESTFRGADLTSLASHKVRGPKGIGALATACGIKIAPLLRGGEQERGVRPGTQDPVAAAGFRAALERTDGPARYAAVAPLRDKLEHEILELEPKATVNGSRAQRAPHVLNISIPGWLGPELAAALDLEGVAVSSGSACSAGTADPSPVIAAMAGIARAKSALRISLGESTTELEIAEAIAALHRVFARGAR